MKTLHQSMIFCAALLLPLITNADARFFQASPQYPDRLSFPGGVWENNGAANWLASPDGSTPEPWTSSADTAVIQNWNGSGHTVFTLSDAGGAVGAHGVIITNNLREWVNNVFNGSALHLGSGGVSVFSDAPNTFVAFNNPLALTSAEPTIFRSALLRALDSSGSVYFTNVISSVPGLSTPVVFDGFGRADPAGRAGALKSMFDMRADNTYSGATTLRGGAVLFPMVSAKAPGRKLDPQSALIMNGGGLVFCGVDGANMNTQRVSSLVVKAGENFITGKNARGVFDAGMIAREGLGGTVSFPINWAGGIVCYADNQNADGILGGWALLNDGAFAAMSATRAVGQNNGAQRWTTDDWADNQHVLVFGGGVRTKGDVSPITVRYQAKDANVPAACTNDLGGAVLTIKSGGIQNGHSDGGKLAGGVLRSGYETGELFVFTQYPFEISCEIADNADSGKATTLVKSRTGRLLLSGALSYTGETYLNGGTLALAGSGALLRAPCRQAGGTWLELSDGASIAFDGAALGGNLRLGAGARLHFAPGAATAPLALTNPYAALDVTADSENPVVVDLRAESDFNWRRGERHPLIALADGVAQNSVSEDDFLVTPPSFVQAHVEVSARGVDLVVDGVSGGTYIILR